MSATECFAVGTTATFGNGQATLIEHWNGTTWTIVPSASPTGAAVLRGVSCTSSTFCVAVGDTVSGSSRRFVEQWNGSQWSIVLGPTESGTSFGGVSCASPTFCVAVGWHTGTHTLTLAELWNGVSWSVMSTADPSGINADYLHAVACGSTTSCEAVGQANYPTSPSVRTLVEHWNGTTWSVVASPNRAGADKSNLLGVSCPSATSCYAAGAASGQTLIEQWNGSAWSIATNAPTTSGALFSVGCAATTRCAAAGNFNIVTKIEQFDGTAWSVAPAPVGSSLSSLNAVGCFGVNVCFAVGAAVSASTGTYNGLVERWNGTGWATTPSPAPAGGVRLLDVGCGSSTSCFAVGVTTDNTKAVIERWDGSTWQVITHPSPAGGTFVNLTGVSCASATFCIAVGQASFPTSPATAPLVERWNGTSWTIVAAPHPNGSEDSTLRSVSCISAVNCMAVGQSLGTTLIERWNGTSWSIVASPNPGDQRSLNAVSCFSASSCFAVGREVVSGMLIPLALRWNGSTWAMTPTPSLTRDGGFRGVKCTSNANCFSVGDSNSATLIEQWNGVSWSISPSPNPAGAIQSFLSDVACPSATTCHAVGGFARRTDGAIQYTLAERLS
ncbi:MAG: hypothetical protein M3Q30_15275 [Actinomycetota bacterium]|nr:hypothetical protein [Actinomycetota bacterium]